ncbi:Uncharacterized protein OBRU01_21861 [Operophtera brumata]|uniref:Uncharacterized protein n=1 Tax=Operophtera brumata TaxID=104452 RepID=A0A0L7KSJ6_OPEBR|nr:Uncharacterized protein OBRU01_21861 [Operophtera brumata]
MPLLPEQCPRFMTFLKLGISKRRTARMVGVTLRTVQKVKRRYEETGNHLRRLGNGRPSFFRPEGTTLVTVPTVRRRLSEANLKPRRAASGPKLEREH